MYFSVSRKVAALTLSLLLFIILLVVLAGGSVAQQSPAVGQIIFADAVTVNSQRALAGTSIFSGSRLDVACAHGNWALLTLEGLGLIRLAPGTQMILRFSPGIISGELATGKAVIHHTAGVKVSVRTPPDIAADQSEQGDVFTLTAFNDARCASAEPQTAASTLTAGAGFLAGVMVGVRQNAVATNAAWARHDASASSVVP